MLSIPITISFTLSDILICIGGILFFVLIIYAIVTLRELYIALKAANQLYTSNEKDIVSLIKSSSTIAKKVEVISNDIPEDALQVFNDFSINNIFSKFLGILSSMFFK